MIDIRELHRSFRELEELEAPVLTVYADIDPSNPDNRGGAWRKRVKNALAEIPEIHERPEHDKSLYEHVLEMIADERPEARTMVLVAKQNHLGKVFCRRIDLNVHLPIADLRAGKAAVRYGEPWLGPLAFALDEFQPVAVLHVWGARWRLYEIAMGRIREIDDCFAELDEEDWTRLREAARFIRSGRLRAQTSGDLSGSNKDRWAQKLAHWKHKLYVRLGRLVEKALDRLGIDRLIVMGDEAETGVLLNALPRRARERVVARIHSTEDLNDPNPGEVLARAQPVIEEAERKGELALLDEIREQPGVWGLGPVLEALQLGRLEVIVLPWGRDFELWRCPDSGLVAASREAADTLCDSPEPVRLGEVIFDLARDYATRIEFVAGEAEERLEKEFDGIAGKRRW